MIHDEQMKRELEQLSPKLRSLIESDIERHQAAEDAENQILRDSLAYYTPERVRQIEQEEMMTELDTIVEKSKDRYEKHKNG